MGGRVLVVDDSQDSREIIAALLESKGHEVRQAVGGQEALSLVQAQRPDLVLLDLHMPDLNGLEVCRRLCEAHDGVRVPVVFVSSEHASESKVEAFRAGAVDYVTKPFEFGEVVARVEGQLQLVRLEREAAARASELAALNAKLERLLEERKNFVSALVHDLKNPLTPVLANIRWLLEEGADTDERQEALRDVHLAAQHLNRMVLSLLDVTRADERGLEPRKSSVEVRPWLEEALELARLQLRATPARLVSRCEGEPTAVFDPALLRRVVQNLCDNALRHGPAESPIEVQVTVGPGGALALNVRDFGPGLPPALLSGGPLRWGAHGTSGSHGLGLDFCLRAVAAHGGSLRAEQGAPTGSVFVVELPPSRAPSP